MSILSPKLFKTHGLGEHKLAPFLKVSFLLISPKYNVTDGNNAHITIKSHSSRQGNLTNTNIKRLANGIFDHVKNS